MKRFKDGSFCLPKEAMGMSFGGFLVSFSAVAVGMALEGMGNKIGEFWVS